MKTRLLPKVYLTFLVIGFVFSELANAQCPASATMVIKESRCRENGSITVNVSPAGSYTYEITSGPELAAVSSSNVFSGLEAGNYVVTIHGSGSCKLDVFATVPGSYQDPGLLNAAVTDILCPTGTGCINAAEPVNGRKPYTYSIISGPVTRPSQSSKNFCGLPAGDYKLQAYDSCGVVRTSDFSIGYDTSDFYAFVYDWDINYANCNDIIINCYKGYTATTVHKLLMVWYITPDGDTLKVNGYNANDVDVDTLAGMAGKFGTWQIIVFDECNRQRVSSFEYYQRGIWIPTFDGTCNGTYAAIDNPWRFGVGVGYTVKKCSDDSVVYHEFQPGNTTDWWSNHFFLNYDTCYVFESYNECGDTVRWTNSFQKPAFQIDACAKPACLSNGKVQIVLSDASNSLRPINFTIIGGPDHIGMTTSIATTYESSTSFNELTPGTYSILAVNGCNERDTLVVIADEPLNRQIDITQKPNCSGGANVHIKISSNFHNCYDYSIGDYLMYVDYTTPAYTATNIQTKPNTDSSTAVWEADYLNVSSNKLGFRLLNPSGCTVDTSILIKQYVPPALTNFKGYVCNSSAIATLNFDVNNGGVAPFKYRIKPDNSTIWGPWQDSSVFAGVTVGTYDVNVVDACPNGSIRSINFTAWEKSLVKLSNPCAIKGKSFTMSADPALDVVSYEWILNGSVVATGPSYTIPSYAITNDGQYKLRQTYRGGICVDSSSRWILSCSVLPIKFGEFTGRLVSNTSLLKWKTTSEQGQVNFIIERSADGQSFKKIGEVKSQGLANGADYGFIDREPMADNYYRIGYKNESDKQQYSNIVRIAKKDLVQAPIKVRPVPFRTWFVVEVTANKKEQYFISLYDLVGNRIAKKTANLSPGVNTVWFENEVESLAAGYYFVEVTGPGISQKIKVLKE